MESVVAKCKDSIYVMGKRSKNWDKFKKLYYTDFIIICYILEDNRLKIIKLGLYNNNNLIYQGSVALGIPKEEEKILEFWEKNDVFKKVRESKKGKELYRWLEGPPTANGLPHAGHALTRAIKDVFLRYKLMKGYDIQPYIAGWDCHGLPIELQVEKKKGKAGVKISAAEFRTACREYASKQVNGQRDDFIRLGVFGDWAHPYLSMDYKFEADIIRSLGKVIANGHLHKGSKPVHWCIDCGSALAEAEVESEDTTSPAIDVRLAALDDAASI